MSTPPRHKLLVVADEAANGIAPTAILVAGAARPQPRPQAPAVSHSLVTA